MTLGVLLSKIGPLGSKKGGVMRKSKAFLFVVCLTAMGTTGPASATSDAQRAYDACTKSYNNTFRNLPGHKAIVSGINKKGTQCFWTYDVSDESAAIDRAMNNCRRTGKKCYLYNADGKNQGWVQRISDMGGNDGTRSRSGGSSGGDLLNGLLGAATGVLNGAAAAQRSSGGGSRSSGSISAGSGYSQKGAFDDCARVYAGAGQAALAAECRARSSNMGSLR